MCNSQKFKHKNRERLCYCCNELQPSIKDIKKFTVANRRQGSIYEDAEFTIQLCPKCSEKVNPIWFENRIQKQKYNETIYKDEKKIDKLIRSFPICNQEYVLNIDNPILGAIDRDEWIEWAINEAKQYGSLEFNKGDEFDKIEYDNGDVVNIVASKEPDKDLYKI